MVKNAIVTCLNNINTGVTNIITNIVNVFNKVNDINTAIVNYFANIVNDIKIAISDMLVELFVPGDEYINDIKTKFTTRFGIVFQIKEYTTYAYNSLVNTDTTPPRFQITIMGQTYQIIDFSYYQSYRTYIHGIIIAIAYYKFIMWLIKAVPSLLSGFTSTPEEPQQESSVMFHNGRFY